MTDKVVSNGGIPLEGKLTHLYTYLTAHMQSPETNCIAVSLFFNEDARKIEIIYTDLPRPLDGNNEIPGDIAKYIQLYQEKQKGKVEEANNGKQAE